MPDAMALRIPHRTLSLGEATAAVAVLALVMLITTPQLASFPGALTPWPAHGIAMAIVLATGVAHRRRLGGVLAVVAFTVCVVNVYRTDATLLRAVGASVLLVGQTYFAVFLYDIAAKGAPPLSGTLPYAYLLIAAVLASVPVTLVGGVGIAIFGAAAAPEYSGWLWWTASASSGTALLGGALVILALPWRGRRKAPAYIAEFAVLLVAYTVALVAAFVERGPLAGIMTPAAATLPFLAWGGFRFGVRGFGVMAAMLIVVVTASTWVGVGPYARMDLSETERFRRSWVYLAATVGPAMIFPVALAERTASARRANAALAQLRAIIEGSGDLIAAVDRGHVVLAASTSWVRKFEEVGGVEFVAGRTRAEDSERSAEEREASRALWDRALAGDAFTVTRTIGPHAGAAEEYEITYSPIRDGQGLIAGASQVMRDVTLRRRQDIEEAESRRLESVGRLAGGVAHDFNNLMTVVLGYTELLRASFPSGDARLEDLAEVERAASRAGLLTQQLLAFARRREVEPQDIDVSELVHGIVRLLSPVVGPEITMDVRTAPGLSHVRLDPAQFEQVVMNLALNARDAMPDGGRLTIETAAAARGGVAGVRLRVRDSGLGMPADVKARVFEPFFTTKPIGSGTGLGLATVHGIVVQAGGGIEVRSAPGAGTTFDVFLPAASAAAPVA
ncbi:MAG: PAS domain-containing protein [Gemmatimonadales bacterium]|nr:PAS domain-containing protein [Gemmatimonadales bacterium]